MAVTATNNRRTSLVLSPEQYHIIETWAHGAGKLLKEWRESRNMSQAKLADKVLCSHSLIDFWEREKKQPTGQRKEMLLAAIAPKNLVRICEDGFTTGRDLDALLAQIQREYETPAEQWYHLLLPNVPKVLICITMKATGNIMPGVDISACKLFKEWFEKCREEYELAQGKRLERVSTRGRKWLESSLSSTPSADVVTSNTSESIVNESTPTTE